ncbi:hypothetical protein FQR65_LT14736 [Abscondita terminalis]|nr:hypothetical protein FQR65_LT14736 [Abscondita terminalis]
MEINEGNQDVAPNSSNEGLDCFVKTKPTIKPVTLIKASAQVRGGVSLDLFYDELSPYGNWDDDPTYGEVWYPDAGRDFRPYSSNGYWAMTEYGNTWVSDYPWGWAPFHYGRWVYSNYAVGMDSRIRMGTAWVSTGARNEYTDGHQYGLL